MAEKKKKSPVPAQPKEIVAGKQRRLKAEVKGTRRAVNQVLKNYDDYDLDENSFLFEDF